MKKVIIISHDLTPSTTFIYHQFIEMSKIGTKVKGYTFEDRSNGNYNINFSTIPKPTFFEKFLNSLISKLFKKIYYKNYNGFLFLKNEIKEFNPDLILIHFGTTLVKIYDEIAFFKKPIVTIFHGFDASQYLRNSKYVDKLKLIFKKKTSFASCVAYDMISRLSAHNINTENIFYNHLGVDTEYFKSTNETKHENFLQVSNFVEKKGHFVTIRSFKIFIDKTNDKDCKLILAGDGPLHNQVVELIKNLSLEDRVILKGSVNIDEVYELMNQNKYFVHHSITSSNGDQEGIPTVIMEAMSMDMSVISTYHSGIPELISSNDLGLLVRENDKHQMSEAFYSIKKMKFRPRNHIISNFDLKKNTFLLIESLEKICYNFYK